MATDIERLRSDIGANLTSLPDEEAQAILDEASEKYSDAGSQTAYARVVALRRLLASSAKLTSYRQNNSQENLSDVFKHVQELLKYWQGELAAAVNAAGVSGAARFGKSSVKPARIKEYPGY